MQTGCVIACEGMQEKQGVVHGNDDDKGRKKNEINCVNFGRTMGKRVKPRRGYSMRKA